MNNNEMPETMSRAFSQLRLSIQDLRNFMDSLDINAHQRTEIYRRFREVYEGQKTAINEAKKIPIIQGDQAPKLDAYKRIEEEMQRLP